MREESRGMLSSGHDRAMALMNSKQLLVSVQSQANVMSKSSAMGSAPLGWTQWVTRKKARGNEGWRRACWKVWGRWEASWEWM